MPTDKQVLGVAGEYAVASELCRRDLYAQVTYGNRKRIDLLLFSKSDQLLRIEVDAKQGATWPNCKGIHGSNSFLVLVDYQKKSDMDRPDFYILTEKDWKKLINKVAKAYSTKYPNRRVEVGIDNCLVLWDEIMKSGKPYRGHSIQPAEVKTFAEAWSKIQNVALK